MERPILMQGELVRGARGLWKTETRRLRDLEHINGVPQLWKHVKTDPPDDKGRLVFVFQDASHMFYQTKVPCPYGNIGDVLWVRENWAVGPGYDGLAPSDIVQQPYLLKWYEADGALPIEFGKLRPSIHMPRWLSRTFLQVVAITVERLQSITPAGAKAEGAEGVLCQLVGKEHHGQGYTDYVLGFQRLWDRINGKKPKPGKVAMTWAHNPWVWVIKFKLLTDYK